MPPRSHLLCIAILAGGAAALAQTNLPPTAAQAGRPRIQFDSTTFSFGRAPSGEVVKHCFVFTNTGTATLEIIAVKPGCGCTTAGTWDKQVEPGKTGIIPLQFNSTGFSGQVAKSASVTCNDPGRSNVMLELTGTVWKPIDITPQMIMFNLSAEAPTNETKLLVLANNLEEPITLSDLKSSNPAFKVEMKEIKPGKEFELLVTAVPPFASPTSFSIITLKTSSTNAPRLSISAYAMVQQAVAVTPQPVMLPVGPLKAPIISTVFVRNNSTNPLIVSNVGVDLPGVQVKVAEPQTGRLYSISMIFPAGFLIEPGQRPELTFNSSHPKYPLIKVPLMQMQPMPAAAAIAPAPAGPLPLPNASPLRGPQPLRPAGPGRPAGGN